MKKNRYLVCNEDLKGRWEIRVRESNCLLFSGTLPECDSWINLMEKRYF